MLERIISIIADKGDKLSAVAMRLGVGVVGFGVLLWALVWGPAVTSAHNTERMMMVHVEDMRSVSKVLEGLMTEMRRHSNQLAQSCTNDAKTEADSDKCFDALNGAAPKE